MVTSVTTVPAVVLQYPTVMIVERQTAKGTRFRTGTGTLPVSGTPTPRDAPLGKVSHL